MKNLKLYGLLIFGVVTLASCSDDEEIVLPPIINEEELITTVTTTLVGGGQTITLTSKDLDGSDGPNDPVVTVSGPLLANTSYTGSVSFLNETENPVENITSEVVNEGVDHQVFYQFPPELGTFAYTDTDVNGKPIGVTFTFTTQNPASGNLIVTLIHLPKKSAAGVATGNIANAAGSTDAQVSYPIVVN